MIAPGWVLLLIGVVVGFSIFYLFDFVALQRHEREIERMREILRMRADVGDSIAAAALQRSLNRYPKEKR